MAPQDESMYEEEAVEEPQEEEEDVDEARTRRKRHKKMKMGEESGLTENDRRALRKEQRELNRKLHEGPEDANDKDFVQKARKKNNELFESVRFTREAVLDAENVVSIAETVAKQVDDMVHVPRYDVNKLINKLKTKVTGRHPSGSSYFDWAVLGTEAGVCYNSLPSRVTFLVGPLENGRVPPKKVRVARQKKSDIAEEKLVEQKPEEQAKREQKSSDQLSQAERDLGKMRKILTRRAKETYEENKAQYEEIKSTQPDKENDARKELKQRGDEVDLVPFLVNPKSFTQTVENLFNASFLIKKGEAKIKMRKSQPLGDSDESVLGLETNGCFIGPAGKEEDSPPKQCVISFNMRDWKRLCDAYELDGCEIPHRKMGKKQQVQMSQEEEAEMEE